MATRISVMRSTTVLGRLGPLLAGLALLAFQPAASADTIYRQYDAQGNVVFTDRPNSGPAEQVDVRPANSSAAPPASAPQRQQAGRREAAPSGGYEVRITTPHDEQGVRAPDGRVAVNAEVTPALREDHRLQLLVNGEPQPIEADNGTFDLEWFERGENHLQVRILGPDRRELARSARVTFYLLRPSLLQPAPANPAPNFRPPPRRPGGAGT